MKNAGYTIPKTRIIEEVVSGSVAAMERKEFSNLVTHKLEAGDTLVVLKLDRLGRDCIDLQKTVDMLIAKGIKLICLDLPIRDLSKPEGRMMLQMFGAFAEFERNRIKERTKQGLQRVKAQGKVLGRPVAVNTTEAVLEHKAKGLSQSQVAKLLNLSVRTVSRHWTKTL
ncbi:recombinase family protein [Citrobacter freundii]|uniref:recombinase family protein n=1 Tax=Citrobacter freundii TaxID=546 RepID=UPI001F2CA3C9|nr:recombinase family protein [Citrobacter freundii]MCF0036263.1 recombinase family protein [Citrobacter freundii]